jgi:Tfp pilus assembly PilM family ATPase
VAVGNVCFFARPLSAVWTDPDASSLLADEIRLSIDYYMAQPRAKSVGQVVLSGPGSSNDELTHQLGMELGLPVEVAGPLGSLDASALSPDDDPRRYTVAAGLSLGAAA